MPKIVYRKHILVSREEQEEICCFLQLNHIFQVPSQMGDDVSGNTSDIIEQAAHIPQVLEPLLSNQDVSMAKNNKDIDQTENEPKELVIDIPKDLEPASWPECCIYKVPKRLRNINETAYTPQFVSIGPFHYGNKTLQAMEKQKMRYLVYFCKRTGKTGVQLQNQIKKREEKIRRHYEDSFELTSNEFVKMMLLDSVFIVELFLRCHEGGNDFILGKTWRKQEVSNDLILLENQVPYFLLEDIYNFAFHDSGRRDLVTFFELTYGFLLQYIDNPEEGSNHKGACDLFSFLSCFWTIKCFACQNYNQPNVSEEELQERPQDSPIKLGRKFEKEQTKNFTDVIRNFRSHNPPKPNGKIIIDNRYSATQLHEEGVKFKADPGTWPLGIKFEGGILRMPIFEVSDYTECLIRNLMALEQCHYPDETYICSYVLLLDSLINTEKDVDILIQNGVLRHLLGDNQEVAKLVNNLCKQIGWTQHCFSDLCDRLNQHYENCWYRTIAIMRSVYFSNLWRGTGTVAALILLLLTFIQSVYSVMRIF